jgi:hypothetical protein
MSQLNPVSILNIILNLEPSLNQKQKTQLDLLIKKQPKILKLKVKMSNLLKPLKQKKCPKLQLHLMFLRAEP